MNCTTAEKLLPLYVEGDMSEPEMANVRAHLFSCGQCREFEEEFRASQLRLHNFSVPEFGADFYEQLRGAVLTEINSRPQARPSFFQTLRPLFVGRPAAAFSLALLVLFGALSFGLHRSLLRRDGSLVAIEKSMGEFNLDQFTEASAQGTEGDSNSSAGVRQTQPAVASNVVRQRARINVRRSVEPSGSNTENSDAAVSTTARKLTQPDAAIEKAAPAQAVARMDIQTSDPNIRIIWLGRNTGK